MALPNKSELIGDVTEQEFKIALGRLVESVISKPIRLDETNDLDIITNPGIYHIPTGQIGSALGLPSNTMGQLIVGGYTQPPTSGFVFQTFISEYGAVYFRHKSDIGWQAWRGCDYRNLESSDNLDDFLNYGEYTILGSNRPTYEKNYPFVGSGSSGKLFVSAHPNDGAKMQTYTCQQGIASRFWTSANGWQKNWSGVKFEAGKLQSITANLVDNFATLADSIDNFTENGEYFMKNGPAVPVSANFPFRGYGGYLKVYKSADNICHQRWETWNGIAHRYGILANGIWTWQAWRGFTQSAAGITELSIALPKIKLIVYGSSTMWYLSDEMQDLATRKNLDLKNHGISGDTTFGAGQAQGSNKVTLQFPNAVITNGSNNPTIESSFGGVSRQNRAVELSNGVKGTLNTNGMFVTSNILSNLEVDPNEKYLLVEPDWYSLSDGVYVIDIGKNDVSTTIDNSAEIIDRTVAMIEYLPKNTKFVVGGHFSNTNSNDIHRTVVESINLMLHKKYGLKYFDINELLFAESTWSELGLTKTAADLTAIAQRRLPPSLSRDTGHLSAGMDIILARSIENKLISLGYIV